METLTLSLTAAEHNLGGNFQPATANASKYKKRSNIVNKKLELSILLLEDMWKTYQERVANKIA